MSGAYFASPPGEDALVITGPPRSGTTLLLELLACDEETWRPLTGPEALVPGAGDGDGDVLTSALAGPALAFQSTKEAHYEEVDGPTECRSLLENAGAPYVLWWGPVRKSTSELGARGLTDAPDFDLCTRCSAGGPRLPAGGRRAAAVGLRLLPAGARGRAPRGRSCRQRRWLLKDPCHLFSLDELFDTLPKARSSGSTGTRPRYQPRSARCCPKSGGSSTARRRQHRRRVSTTPSSPTSANY